VGVICVPPLEAQGKEWYSLGGEVAEFLTGIRADGKKSDRFHGSVFGPGSLKGEPYRLDTEKLAATYRAYEIYPPGHPLEGRRRFKRVGISWRKGTAKTEWAAEIAYAELHPMVAYTQDQSEELAFGALFVIVQEGYDADYFDVALERILRVDGGRPDGKAVALSGSPNANDGARTTFQHFDETHRQELPRLVAAHETMLGNIPKRPLEDPWTLETTTAGRPGANSVAEETHKEAIMIAQGKIDEPDLCYFHREAGPNHDMTTLEGRIAAVAEATGPVGEYGPGQFRDIAKQWDRPKADKSYLERVWLNRWTKSDEQAYDVEKFEALGTAARIPHGSFVTVGFEAFEVPIEEVNQVVLDIFENFDVWQLYADPPHYVESVAQWENKHPDQVTEWWTNRRRPMGKAAKAYREAINTGVVTHTGNADFIRHVGNAGRVDTNLYDDDGNGEKVWILGKLKPELKFDLCMAGVLSWQARLDALAAGAQPSPAEFVPYRIR
jgi:hypothetical protein